MPLFYLDSSALVKRYVEEAGTDVLNILFDEHPADEFLATLSFSILEVKSAFNRLVKGKVVKEGQAGEFRAHFRKDLSELTLILPLNEQMVEDAISLVDTHRLRAGDALHMAAAVRLKEMAQSAGDSVVMISSDAELNDVCRTAGIGILDPGDYGAGEQLRRLRAKV